jgi:molybdopterin/thiamine biosynthesis adenylyltransferase
MTGGLSKRRLVEELRAIATRYPSMGVCPADAGRLTFEGLVDVDGVAHRVRLSLPPSYPSVPPELRELDLETGVELPPDGRSNRLDDWGLCLFPHGNDDQAWRQDRLAVEALDRFADFIRSEAARSQQNVYWARERLHIPPRAGEWLLDLGPGVLYARRAEAGGDLYIMRIHFDGGLEHNFDQPNWENFLPIEVGIPWIVFRGRESLSELTESVELLDAALRRQLADEICQLVCPAPFLVLVMKGKPGSGIEVEITCIHRPPERIGTLLRLPVVRDTPADCLFHRVDGVLNHRDTLAQETVILVGLGSLGSAVAVALARAGVRRFMLIDPDTLSIENVCRHVGTLPDLGRSKVEIVSDVIRSINPAAQVEPIAKWLAWDLPWLGAGVEFEHRLARDPRCLIISTCAAEIAERQLNAIAVVGGVPVIYASALGAAEHGRVFRVRPGRSPCLECILTAQDQDPASFPRFISAGANVENPPAYLAPALPGLGIDVTAIAMITARLALQTIAELRGGDLGLPPETGDHLLWSNRGGWLFDRPQQLIVERYPRSPTCSVCGPAREDDELDGDGDKELAGLLTELQRR